jgi:F0F1-type ATP synthase delta subunit
MLRDDKLAEVFFGKEVSANPEAEILKTLLESADIESIIRWKPPTFQSSGGVSLMVLESQREEALAFIEQAQMDEGEDMSEEHPKGKFVTVFSSKAIDAELEAETIHGVLESARLSSVIVRENVPELPTGGVEVRVLPQEADEARALIKAALKSGSSD